MKNRMLFLHIMLGAFAPACFASMGSGSGSQGSSARSFAISSNWLSDAWRNRSSALAHYSASSAANPTAAATPLATAIPIPHVGGNHVPESNNGSAPGSEQKKAELDGPGSHSSNLTSVNNSAVNAGLSAAGNTQSRTASESTATASTRAYTGAHHQQGTNSELTRPLDRKKADLNKAASSAAHPSPVSTAAELAQQARVIADSKDRLEFENEARKIPGAAFKKIDLNFADEVLNNCPKTAAEIVINIQKNIFREGEKDAILYGVPGTGKSTIPLAIAKKCDIPCLFFIADKISTEWQNGGIQNLGRIFDSALKYGKPCIVVLDELEALTDKHVSKENNEKGMLRSLWSELDRIKNSKIIVMANMNNRENLPMQMFGRAAQIEVPLPTQEQREKAFTFHLADQSQQYNIKYDADVTAKNLAGITYDFSYRDIRDLVIKATRNAVRSDDNKLVTMQDCALALATVVNDPQRKSERAKGTWFGKAKEYLVKNHIAIIGITISAAAVLVAAHAVAAQKAAAATAAAAVAVQNEISNRNAAESLGYQKIGAGAAAGAAVGGLIGGVIGGITAGPGGAAAGAKAGGTIGATAGGSLGTLACGGAKVLKQAASKSYNYASKSCSLQ